MTHLKLAPAELPSADSQLMGFDASEATGH
jgi:hypothetical protein